MIQTKGKVKEEATKAATGTQKGKAGQKQEGKKGKPTHRKTRGKRRVEESGSEAQQQNDRWAEMNKVNEDFIGAKK